MKELQTYLVKISSIDGISLSRIDLYKKVC